MIKRSKLERRIADARARKINNCATNCNVSKDEKIHCAGKQIDGSARLHNIWAQSWPPCRLSLKSPSMMLPNRSSLGHPLPSRFLISTMFLRLMFLRLMFLRLSFPRLSFLSIMSLRLSLLSHMLFRLSLLQVTLISLNRFIRSHPLPSLSQHNSTLLSCARLLAYLVSLSLNYSQMSIIYRDTDVSVACLAS